MMWRIAMPKTRHFPSDTHRTLMSAYAGWVARGLVGGTALSSGALLAQPNRSTRNRSRPECTAFAPLRCIRCLQRERRPKHDR